MGRSSHRTGFTLIELVLVIAIMGAMVIILLPAAQKVREAASQTICKNNLKQVALGCHLFHYTHRYFPFGMHPDAVHGTNNGAANSGNFKASNFWHVRPYLEQANAPVGRRMALLACPSEPRSGSLITRHPVHGWPVGLTDYVFVEGLRAWDAVTGRPDGLGVATTWEKVRMSEVKDGLGSTLMIGERPPSADLTWGWWGFLGLDTQLGVAETWQRYQSGAFGPCPLGPHRSGPGSIDNNCDVHHFWSTHPGGGNWAFADGSVRWLAYSASPLTLPLATRAGGEAVGEIP
jgi:prepilin-type processing-associated H-X9-DG protein/prepilin-type N-terminal cleavage/methylation domain-containing protein